MYGTQVCILFFVTLDAPQLSWIRWIYTNIQIKALLCATEVSNVIYWLSPQNAPKPVFGWDCLGPVGGGTSLLFPYPSTPLVSWSRCLRDSVAAYTNLYNTVMNNSSQPVCCCLFFVRFVMYYARDVNVIFVQYIYGYEGEVICLLFV